MLDGAFNSPSKETLAPFEELRGRQVLALAIVGKFLRTTGAHKDIADQFLHLEYGAPRSSARDRSPRADGKETNWPPRR